MFRCVSCPTALCSLHVPKDCKVVPQNILEERGYSSSSFHFIFCHKCEPAELDCKPGQKRTASEAGLDIASILKKRKVGSNQMIKSPPDEQILIPMRGLFSSGFVFQKQVADEIGISQPLLSQYVHGATRNNGWRFLEEKLKIWLDKHTDLVARLESDTRSAEIPAQPQQPVVQEPIIKQEPIVDQRVSSNDVKIRLRLNLQSQPDLEPKHQPMWEPHRNYIPILTNYQIAALQQQEENTSLILESPTFYASDSSEIEVEETGVWAIDIFQQHNRSHESSAFY
jgi:transcriptional regulator with XRE-family HTH domain